MSPFGENDGNQQGTIRPQAALKGHPIFVDELTRFAQRTDDPRVKALAARTAAPLRVLVRGRQGVGCSTVARALNLAGRRSAITVTTSGSAADLQVYVLAEVVKPEDRAAMTGVLAVLNKADLTGFRGEGPMAAASDRCAQFAPLLGVPVLPISGLLAVAGLDDLDAGNWAALQELAAHPGGLGCLDGSFDGFLTAHIPVPVHARRRLLEALDLFGIALSVAAVRAGGRRCGATAVQDLLRRVSGVDAVIDRLVAAGAEVRYRRLLEAVAELEALAVVDPQIGEFLASDDTIIGRMADADDAVQACGPEAGPAEPLPRAVHWQRYSRTSVSELHRACGADIARGSLRLWARSTGALREDRETR